MDSNLLIVTIKPRSALCYMLFRMFFHLLFPVTSYSPFLSSCRQRGHSSKRARDLLTIAQLISSSISTTKELLSSVLSRPRHLLSVEAASLSVLCYHNLGSVFTSQPPGRTSGLPGVPPSPHAEKQHRVCQYM